MESGMEGINNFNFPKEPYKKYMVLMTYTYHSI